MSLVHDEALLLRRSPYGDADEVVSLLTRSHGKIQALAKHSRASRRRFPGGLEPLVKFEAAFRQRGGALAFLESAQPLKAWPALLASMDRLALSWRLLEVADLLKESGESLPEFFSAVEEGLNLLSQHENPREACLRAESRLLSLSGWAPRCDACVSCRKPWPFPGARLSHGEGGLVCRDCGRAGRPLSASECQALSRLVSGDAGPVAGAEAAFLDFLQYQLGRGLKTIAWEMSLR